MKRLWNIVKRHGFVLLLAAVLLWVEGLLRLTDPIKYMTPIWRDDFELLQLEHPEQVWDKIFFGSSAVTASYIEGQGDSGYINAGIDYGTIRDLWEMLDKGYAQVGSEIVLGINELSFLDTLPTNPTYAWHREWYEPYLYFQRDRLYKLITDGVNNVMDGKGFVTAYHTGQQRVVYRGHLSDEQLSENLKSLIERFGNMTPNDCTENFAALEKLSAYCGENGIRLRAVWMPRNSKVEIYPAAQSIMDAANEELARLGIETIDLTHAIEHEYFYDTGHLDYDTGSPYFTDLIEPWLSEED